MKADWIIQIELRNFFDSKAELRARTKKGILKDQIYRGVFASTLEEEFNKKELNRALDTGLLAKESIYSNLEYRIVYLWLEKECSHQPSRYKRWLSNVKGWLIRHGILN